MIILFCNISWMREYKGNDRIDGVEDHPKRGGKWVVETGKAHECCNFLSDKNRIVYGHVETWRGDENGMNTKIKIETLGADKDAPFIDGITVVWIATHENGGRRVIGWYKNAKVYRARQQFDNFPTSQHRKDDVSSYRITARYKDIFLIHEDKRELILDPKKKKKGWPGENSIFYPSKHKNNEELMSFIEILKKEINSNVRPPFLPPKSPKGIYEEGQKKLSQHKKIERSNELIKDFKNQLIDFSCVVCGFSFEKFYGALGKFYIEAHHLIPISSLTERTKISIDDLAQVCSNCHRMLHRSNPPMSIEKLSELIKKNN